MVYLIPALFLASITLLIYWDEMKVRKQVKQEKVKDGRLTTLSHTLRTPLLSIRGYVDMLQHQEVGKLQIAQMELLHRIESELEEAFGVLDESIGITHKDSTIGQSKPADIDLRESIQYVLSSLDEKLDESHRVHFRKGHRKVNVHADPLALHTVLNAIIGNAHHYTGEDGQINVQLEDKPRTVRIKVIDTGIGIDREEIENIFHKFVRGRNACVVHPNGSGLGLHNAKNLLDEMGGNIHLQSKPGKGTKVTITLPKKTK